MNEWRAWFIIAFIGISILVVCELIGIPID